MAAKSTDINICGQRAEELWDDHNALHQRHGCVTKYTLHQQKEGFVFRFQTNVVVVLFVGFYRPFYGFLLLSSQKL